MVLETVLKEKILVTNVGFLWHRHWRRSIQN